MKKKECKDVLFVFDVTPNVNHLEKLSKFYKIIIVIDHH